MRDLLVGLLPRLYPNMVFEYWCTKGKVTWIGASRASCEHGASQEFDLSSCETTTAATVCV